jgi:hypothetical protein
MNITSIKYNWEGAEVMAVCMMFKRIMGKASFGNLSYGLVNIQRSKHRYVASQYGGTMLSARKIKLMYVLEEYETREGKLDLKIGKYYKSDYIHYQLLRSFLHVTFAYVLILSMIALYRMEYLIQHAVVLDYASIGLTVLGMYVLLLAFYMFVTFSIYSLRYDVSRKKLQTYYKYLKLLDNYYRDNQ